MGGRGLEAKDTMGRTALHLMVQDGSVETVAVLLAAGADPLTKDSLGEAVVMLAVNKKRWDMVGLLIDYMRLRGLETQDAMGRTALHLMVEACNMAMIDFLLRCGAKAATQDVYGQTPLLLALRLKRMDIAEVLVMHMGGWGLEVKDEWGRTALQLAVQASNLRMTTLLLSAGAKAVTEDTKGLTPLLLGAVDQRLDIMQVLAGHMGGQGLEAKDAMGRTALHFMVEAGSLEMATLLLSAGANAATTDKDGESPLLSAVKLGRLDIMKVLLKHMAGHGLEAKDKRGGTALHWAVEEDRADMVTLLLSAGASTMAATPKGKTPLILAAINGCVSIAEALLKHMGSWGLEAKDMTGKTALHWAAEETHTRIVTLLVAAGADPMSKTVDGETPLMLAALKGHLGVVNLLAQHMGEQGLQEKNTAGQTALHYALCAEVWEDEIFPVVRALLFAGVPHTGVEDSGATARDYAQQRGSPSCVELIDVSM
jgi:ankyrin repeat protein